MRALEVYRKLIKSEGFILTTHKSKQKKDRNQKITRTFIVINLKRIFFLENSTTILTLYIAPRRTELFKLRRKLLFWKLSRLCVLPLLRKHRMGFEI